MSGFTANDLREMGRRYREAAEREQAAPAPRAASVVHSKTQAAANTPDDLKELISRVDKKKPDPGDVAALRTALEKGGLCYAAAVAGRAQVKALVGAIEASEATRVLVTAEVEELQVSLGYAGCSAVERALIDHIGTCWLRLQLAEQSLTYVTTKQHTLNEGRYREARLTEAQTRYLRALALLERLRRYAPSVQINIANQQVVQGPG